MRLPSLLLIGALLAFGCSKQPEAVFVDLEALAKTERPENLIGSEVLTAKPTAIPAQSASINGSKGIVIADQADAKIDAARRLIDADRESAIRVLTRRLGTLRSAEIDAQKRKALEELAERQSVFLRDVYDQLYVIFQAYAKERGPNFFRVEFLKVKKPDLFVSRTNPTNFAEKQAKELAALKKAVNELDADYEKKARALLDEAQVRLSSDQGSIQAKFETLRANALEQAAAEARRTINKTGGAADLNLGQNRSVAVSATEGRRISIPGSAPSQSPNLGLDGGAVTSQNDVRHRLEQQLEIWLKTEGLARTKNRSDGRDATEEFESWRKTHLNGR